MDAERVVQWRRWAIQEQREPRSDSECIRKRGTAGGVQSQMNE